MRGGLSRQEVQELAEAAAVNATSRPSGWWRANCPFCIYRVGKDDTSGTFSVEKTEGWFKCWRCGIKGRLESIPYEMIEKAEERAEQDKRDPSKPPDGFMQLGTEPGRSAISTQRAREYLQRRYVTPRMMRELQIGAVLSGYYQGRVVVPVLTDDGAHWMGWVARYWIKKGEGPPYMSAPGMARGEMLFNHAALLEETDEPVAVVEGVFDAFAIWPDCCSTLGLSGGRRGEPVEGYWGTTPGEVLSRGLPTEAQMTALVAARRPVVLVLDGDAAEEGWAAAQLLRAMGQRAGAVKLPPTADPDEVDPDWLRRRMRDSLHES